MKGVKCVDCAEYNWDLLWCEKVVDSPDTEMERECRYYHEKDDRDVVKVIRCKDCKYYKENTLVCSRYGLEDDDYCSWAERKEE